MRLIIYGPEGSGKGTQAKLLSDKLGIPVLTSGDLVRKEAKNRESELGRICYKALTTGIYVDNETMFKLWKNEINDIDLGKGFVLDGFPRNIQQAKFLKNLLDESGYSIDAFIYLQIPREETYKRLEKRNRKLFDGSKISHDSKDRIAKRLQEYSRREEDILDFYRKSGKVLQVDGMDTVEGVFENILRLLPE